MRYEKGITDNVGGFLFAILGGGQCSKRALVIGRDFVARRRFSDQEFRRQNSGGADFCNQNRRYHFGRNRNGFLGRGFQINIFSFRLEQPLLSLNCFKYSKILSISRILKDFFGKVKCIMPFQFQFNPRYRFVVNCTTRCNFNCPHCLRQTLDEKKTLRLDLPVSLFKQCLKEFKKINYRYVAFTGGEPILHPDFGRLVAAAVKENFSFSVINNGWFYRDYFPILDKYRLQLTRMSFSLDGSMAAIHDRIRNKSGSYDKVMEGIEFYKNKGFRVWVTSCFNQLNLSDFWNIHKLLDFFKVDDWFKINHLFGRRKTIPRKICVNMQINFHFQILLYLFYFFKG